MNMYNYSYSGRYMSSASGIYQAGTKDCAEKRITMNNQEMMELTTVDKSEFEELVKECTRSGSIDQNLYIEYDVKRGLRDSNGNGVLTGLTEISDVCGNENVHGRKIPVDGQLYFQGYMSRILLKALQEIDSVLKKQLTFFYLVIFLQRDSLTVSLEYLLIYRNFQVHLSEM